MKVCRKSPVIEAFHFTEESVKHPEDWPTWLYHAANKIKDSKAYFIVDTTGLTLTLNYGDYILYDNGKLFVRSSPTFHAYWYEVK